MTDMWLSSSLWLGLALAAALISIRLAVSVALVEIVVGALAGNTIGLEITQWVDFLAGFGAILLTFLAGAEIDPRVIKRHFWSSMSIGLMGFLAPYLGVLSYALFVLHWPSAQAQIAAIALSTTSVAVVYAVMVETGYNRSDIGKIILAACFINDLGTVLALGVVFADFDYKLAVFGAVTALAVIALPRITPWYFHHVGERISEPRTKFVFIILMALGGLASAAKSEAVLPAYLVGMSLAGIFATDPELPRRMRMIAFTILTPFYFLKAGSLVDFKTMTSAIGLITVLLAIKMATKFLGVLPLTMYHRFKKPEGMYTTLLMSTGLTFGTIATMFGLTHGIIDKQQYTVLVSAVIGSAVVPTLIAQTWFQPQFRPIEPAREVLAAEGVAKEEP